MEGIKNSKKNGPTGGRFASAGVKGGDGKHGEEKDKERNGGGNDRGSG